MAARSCCLARTGAQSQRQKQVGAKRNWCSPLKDAGIGRGRALSQKEGDSGPGIKTRIPERPEPEVVEATEEGEKVESPVHCREKEGLGGRGLKLQKNGAHAGNSWREEKKEGGGKGQEEVL